MADVEMQAPGGEGGEQGRLDPYVPVSKRDIKNHELKPVLETCPDFMPDIRGKMYRWYPGPEICMHKMHWTEYIFAIFLVVAIGMVFLANGGGISASAAGLGCSFCAFTALFFVWGIAKYQSLADAATRLEELAAKNHAEVGALVEINNEWDEGLQRSEENLKNMTTSLGLVTDDAKEIQKFEQQLGDLVGAKKKCQAAEMACFQVELRHRNVTRANAVEQRRGNMKETLKRWFDRIDRRSKFGGDHDGSLTGNEIIEFRKKMEADEFLNLTDEETGERLFDWESAFDKIAEDGEIHKFELLDALDVVSDSYFLKIVDAKKNTPLLESKIKELEARVLERKSAV